MTLEHAQYPSVAGYNVQGPIRPPANIRSRLQTAKTLTPLPWSTSTVPVAKLRSQMRTVLSCEADVSRPSGSIISTLMRAE